MKARFTDDQIIAMIKEQEAGEKIADVCRRHGICSARFYKYKSKYGGMESPDANRQAVAHLCKKRSVSQRRACDVLQIDRSWMRYLSRRDRYRAVGCHQTGFKGTPLAWVSSHPCDAREGFAVTHKKIRRIYTEEKLQVHRRGGRKPALGARKPMVVPDGSNQRPLSGKQASPVGQREA